MLYSVVDYPRLWRVPVLLEVELTVDLPAPDIISGDIWGRRFLGARNTS
jgi:hypothetical protein